MKRVAVYDTTLRDGTQGEGISFSAEDKIKIAQHLDGFGVDYIEGGWPGSNPRDIEFFKKVSHIRFRRAKIAAFGSTRHVQTAVEKDRNIRDILEAETPVVTIFGKSWDLHVREALKTTLDENLNMISESVQYLKSKGREVIYDAEHFFDGFKSNPSYAIRTLEIAKDGGADVLVLCDTNGGTITHEIAEIVRAVKEQISHPLGIHCHNDSDMGTANTVIAVLQGCSHVQGTFNGYGERCGNANLCTVIPNLQLKLGYQCIPKAKVRKITDISRYISEVANMVHVKNAPFVGESAFTHKGGIHVSAVMKNKRMYEHITPEEVGNRRRVLLSDLSGRSNVIYKAGEMEIDLSGDSSVIKNIVNDIKVREHNGYFYEDAEGSFELLTRRHQGKMLDFFRLEGFRVIIEKKLDNPSYCEVTIKLDVDGREEHTAAEGDGPVNALDNALRKALEKFYPSLKKMRLTDYKVRVLEGKEGTSAKVRVHIDSANQHATWGTVGVSENIIEASWQALADSINYHLLKYREVERIGRRKKEKK